MAAPFETSVVCPILIGRDAHLAALDRLIAEVLAGAGRTALISGEAGVGKSRLVAQARARFLSRAAPGPPLALAGRCFEPDRVLPYAPLIDIFHALVAAHPPHESAALLGSTSEPTRILTELAADTPAPAADIEPGQERRRLTQAIVQWFTQLAARAARCTICSGISKRLTTIIWQHLKRHAPLAHT